ncbi:VOC family protein [Aliiglaciecola sp. CAU 1673]|uniref:VOC family protein n=1 Tax=Aliiglaciecola sp. CAU 1673 TaxID=3032595 RepID=UPI0023DC4168|nr:VOC family protein [Aliiglaciecola sp. CAU 1673]MDF2176641.1 VOC family protein [Aliiglaciecola sp. CAU 1673]
MIQLEHLNLEVKDIPRSLRFYQAAFPHWWVRGGGNGEWSGKPRQWLHFGDDYQYLAFSDHGEGDNRNLSGHQVGLAHFAFITQNLDALITRLHAAGFAVAKQGAAAPSRRNVYYLDPDGFEVEFVQYLSDQPKRRNDYDQE